VPNSTKLTAALEYRNRGLSIIPIKPGDKRPLIAWEEYQERRADEAEIRGWFDTWGEINLGLVTGEVSGFIVIDIDSVEAKEGLKKHAGDYDLETVPRSRTGKGWQLFFKHPGKPIQNRTGVIPGLDVRGDGGYVVAPPSVHPSGKVYRWEVPINCELPKLPVELFKLITTPASSGENGYRERFDTAQALAGVPEGQRDETLFKLACKLRNADVPQEMAEKLVLEAAQNCQPSFSESIALEKVCRVYKQYQPGATPSDPILFPHPREETVRKEIKLQTWEEFLSTTPEEREYTINGILPDSGLAVLLGRGKQGKSTLATHACRAVATGQSFLEQQTKEKPVVYVNYEMGEDYLQILLRAGDCPREAYIINRPEPILTLKTIEYIMGQVENAPGMMVIDSFRGAFKLQGDAENLSGGAGVLLRQLQDLAINKAWLIILIHHSNRGSREGTDSVSGTGDWIAAPDVLWSWSRPDPNKSGTLTIEGRIPPVEPMAVKSTPEECRYVGTVKEDKDQTDREEILETLTDEGQTADVIAGATGKPPGTVRKRLDTLYKEGRVDREGAGKKNDAFRWVKIHSAQDNPLGAETNNRDNQAEEGDQCQTLDL